MAREEGEGWVGVLRLRDRRSPGWFCFDEACSLRRKSNEAGRAGGAGYVLVVGVGRRLAAIGRAKLVVDLRVVCGPRNALAAVVSPGGSTARVVAAVAWAATATKATKAAVVVVDGGQSEGGRNQGH